ncbi:MAG: hypothetical protein QOF99_937 [Pseudonocardiales bacterium]|nr:hypothetical protein [Pseudonocardiales bacterium]
MGARTVLSAARGERSSTALGDHQYLWAVPSARNSPQVPVIMKSLPGCLGSGPEQRRAPSVVPACLVTCAATPERTRRRPARYAATTQGARRRREVRGDDARCAATTQGARRRREVRGNYARCAARIRTPSGVQPQVGNHASAGGEPRGRRPAATAPRTLFLRRAPTAAGVRRTDLVCGAHAGCAEPRPGVRNTNRVCGGRPVGVRRSARARRPARVRRPARARRSARAPAGPPRRRPAAPTPAS